MVLNEIRLIHWFDLECRGAGFQQREESTQKGDLYAIQSNLLSSDFGNAVILDLADRRRGLIITVGKTLH